MFGRQFSYIEKETGRFDHKGHDNYDDDIIIIIIIIIINWFLYDIDYNYSILKNIVVLASSHCSQ